LILSTYGFKRMGHRVSLTEAPSTVSAGKRITDGGLKYLARRREREREGERERERRERERREEEGRRESHRRCHTANFCRGNLE
jgi:hypothetical protein